MRSSSRRGRDAGASSAEPGGVGSKWRGREQRAERTLILFTKNPNPGRVKTRLVGDLSQVAAAQLHAAFVGDVIERLIDGRYELSVAWALGDGEAPALEMVPAGAAARVRSVVQQEGDLGNRLFRALLEASERSHSVAAVGSDHPTIYAGQVEAAFEALEAGSDVAIGPAADGGYYLIAVRKTALAPGLFEGIEWSTAAVRPLWKGGTE